MRVYLYGFCLFILKFQFVQGTWGLLEQARDQSLPGEIAKGET